MANHFARRLSLMLIAALVLTPVAGRLTAQGAPNLRAEWRDLQRWNNKLPSGETEIGLGLQPSGATGKMLIAFTERRSRSSDRPSDISVQIGAAEMASPNLQRTPSLRFLLDERKAKPMTIDLSSRLTVDDLTPGAVIKNGIATMTRAELAELAKAETIRAMILGTDVVINSAQLKAIQQFTKDISR